MATDPSPPRSILITGASTGIGRDAAETFAKRGWRVFATARKDEDLAALDAAGCHPVPLELRKAASIEAASNHVLGATGGRLDVLFNNAAYGRLGALWDTTPDALRDQMEVGLVGWHDLTRRLLPAIRGSGSGRIVQCSSVLGFVSLKYRGPYQAMKHALEAYTDTLRLELEPLGIKVVSIQPGPITSAFRRSALAAFEATIDPSTSVYADDYVEQLKRLRSADPSRFELGPEAVTRALVQAAESPNPKLVYRVTYPTHASALVKRVLPKRALHALSRGRSRR